MIGRSTIAGVFVALAVGSFAFVFEGYASEGMGASPFANPYEQSLDDVERSLRDGTPRAQAESLRRLFAALAELREVPTRSEAPSLYSLVRPLEQLAEQDRGDGSHEMAEVRLLSALVLIRLDRVRGHQALRKLAASPDEDLSARAAQVIRDLSSGLRFQLTLFPLEAAQASEVIDALAASDNELLREQGALMLIALSEQTQEYATLKQDLLSVYATLADDSRRVHVVNVLTSAELPTDAKLSFLEAAKDVGGGGDRSRDVIERHLHMFGQAAGTLPLSEDADRRIDLRPQMRQER